MKNWVFAASACMAMAIPVSPAPGTPTWNSGAGQRGTAPAATEAEVAASAQALGEVDAERLLTDRDYADVVLGHARRLQTVAPDEPELQLRLDSLSLIALTTLERGDEALAAADRILERRPREASFYAGPWFAAVRFEDHARVVAIAEAATRYVPASGWADLRQIMHAQMVWPTVRALRNSDRAAEVRLAQALLRIGWPGSGNRGGADAMRLVLIEDRLEHGNREEAAGLAASIATPSQALSLIVLKRYDPLFAAEDRIAFLERAAAAHDAETAASLAAAPEDSERIVERTQLLRQLGRSAEALALLEPHIGDVPAAADSGEFGMWLVNEAAGALLDLGRGDEALMKMAALASLPIDENPQLIGPSINYAGMLWQLGRSAEALRHAEWLEEEQSEWANDYGRLWMAAARACALAALDRVAEAQSVLQRMRSQANANPRALLEALLCLGELPAAEALVVERLEGSDPREFAVMFQNHAGDPPPDDPHHPLLMELRERPAVRAALERVAHVLTVPLTRTH